MSYILDTNVVSELIKYKPNQNVIERLMGIDHTNLYISCITIGELKCGILKLRKTNEDKAKSLENWLNELIQNYQKRIIDVTTKTCVIWADLMNITKHNPVDALIASLAIEKCYTLVTRNTKDFEMFNCKLINPFLR